MSNFTKQYKWQYDLIIILFISLFLFFSGYYKHILDGPQGIHFMRQTDGLSFASQYFNNEFKFFEPKLFNLVNNEGRAACEFPILYYISGLLYLIFGKKLFLLKFINFSILFLGFRAFCLTASKYIGDFYLAFISTFLPFTSTVMLYYSFNYLPDIPALGFAMLGWALYLNSRCNSQYLLIGSAVSFMLSGLLKVTYLINPIALLLLISCSYFLPRYFKFDQRNTSLSILLYLSTVFCVIIWYLYVLKYNSSNASNSFNTTALPIWEIPTNEIKQVWEHFTNYWYHDYFAPQTFHLVYFLVFITFIFRKKSDITLSLISTALFLGCSVYFILFYQQFKHHDYYFLAFIPLTQLIALNSFITIYSFNINKNIDYIIKALLGLIFIVGLIHSGRHSKQRFENGWDFHSRTGLLINKYYNELNRIAIDPNSKLIIVPELCPNASLLFLNRTGWTFPELKNLSVKAVDDLIGKGADYLILVSNEKKYSRLVNMIGKVVYSNEDLSVYKLDKSNDSLCFINDCETDYGWGQNRSIVNSRSYSGDCSSVSGDGQLYGLTFETLLSKNILNMDTISVDMKMFKSGDAKGSLLVYEFTKDDGTVFWLNDPLDLYDIDHWLNFRDDLCIQRYVRGTSSLKIYVYNPTKTLIFVDDIKIHIH